MFLVKKSKEYWIYFLKCKIIFKPSNILQNSRKCNGETQSKGSLNKMIGTQENIS
jgi:hypothetical protein